MDFAQLTLQGRLTDDPTVRTLESGTTVCKFTVASNRRIPGIDKERTTYIPVTVFGRDAVNCGDYLSKGREVHVTGNFETDSYTDGKGIKRKGFNVVAREVTFGRGGRKDEDTESTGTFDDLDIATKDRAYQDYLKKNKR